MTARVAEDVGPLPKPPLLVAETEEPRELDQSVTTVPPISLPTFEKAEPPPIQPVLRTPSQESIRLTHAEDFAWIVGKVEYLNSKKCWRLRYATYDVDDIYGGVVTLSGADNLGQMKEGATVRLHGQLIDPSNKTTAPEYFVYEIKILK